MTNIKVAIFQTKCAFRLERKRVGFTRLHQLRLCKRLGRGDVEAIQRGRFHISVPAVGVFFFFR